MDSEHRHELEENDLAGWLADKIEAAKPHLPAIGVGTVVLVAGLIGLNGWRSSAEAARADRWRDFSVAVEGVQPNLSLLKEAATANAGTPVEEWAEITWADGRLFEAAGVYFRNRESANEAAEDAVEVYQRLVAAKDRSVAERAKFQLARALELQGKLEEAREQYGRVTGAFAEVAEARAEELESKDVVSAYSWITATKGEVASSSLDLSGLEDLKAGDLEPDDIDLPEEDADDTLQGLLDDVEEEVNASAEGESTEPAGEDEPAQPSVEAEGSPTEEASESTPPEAANEEGE